jgi:glycosyltransferase involved in cell wall biosynthesis
MKKRKLRVGLISSYVPKKCGIATHSRDLVESMNRYGDFDLRLIAAEDVNDNFSYDKRLLAVIKKDNLESYKRAAKAMNKWEPDIVLLAHEYGLFGGRWLDISHHGKSLHVPTGDHILTLIDLLKAPVITTFHTVIPEPDEFRRDIVRAISKRSAKIVTMTKDAQSTLSFFYNIDKKHVAVIPHGVPHPIKRNKKLILKELSLDNNRFYLLITGLIGPNKGISLVIRALPEIIKHHPEVILLVVGQTHPGILETAGEEYRENLINLATDLGVCDYVQFVNEYLPTDKLVDYLTIADIYLTIHSDPEQAASGTLAYALGCGLASISTPYRYAKEVLADGCGFLVPFDSSEAIAKQVNILVKDSELLEKTKKKAGLVGRSMCWEKVGDKYMHLIEAIIRE